MKIKNEPGPFIPYSEVHQKLTAAAYGTVDLVELGLFHSEHFVRDAMLKGKLKFQKVNKRAVILCRDDILDYWFKYRNAPYEPVNNNVVIKFTISEIDYITALIQHGQKRVDRDFSKQDLFRNFLSYMKEKQINSVNQPDLFVKHA